MKGLKQKLGKEIARLKSNQQWIPVTERLPDVAGYEVLATIENPLGQRHVTVVFTGYGKGDLWHCNYKGYDMTRWKVIAWMPLPQPYESEVNADIIGVDSEELQCNLAFNEFNKVTEALNKLAHLEDLEEQGLLFKLPCKVGDTVWKIKAVFSYFSKPFEDRVGSIIITKNEILVCCTSGAKFSIDKIGKIVFLTKEEAEQKLKELREVGNND